MTIQEHMYYRKIGRTSSTEDELLLIKEFKALQIDYIQVMLNMI
jgi:hypothetical protein